MSLRDFRFPMSNLPPGVTDRMIDDYFGGDPEEICEYCFYFDEDEDLSCTKKEEEVDAGDEACKHFVERE